MIAGLFCDLSRAFDSVNHSVLLQNLFYYAVRETYHNWFKSYLTNRQRKVIITINGGNHSSNWEIVNSGVPQGSILGPLLIKFYVNDLPHIIQQFSKPVIYANDTSILIQATNIMELHAKVNDTIHHIKE